MQVKSYSLSSSDSDKRYNQVVVTILADRTIAVSALNGVLLYREPVDMQTDDDFADFLPMDHEEQVFCLLTRKGKILVYHYKVIES